MTSIRTTCDRCGDVELTPTQLTLELSPNTSTGSYRFDCPFCLATQRRPAGHRVVSILLATGVVYRLVDDESPITEDEILAFRDSLDEGDWYSQLQAS